LTTEAKVPGIDEKTFQEKAQAAKKGCPVSKALSDSIEIRLTARRV
jgi:osmotically inducible protein OsmC